LHAVTSQLVSKLRLRRLLVFQMDLCSLGLLRGKVVIGVI
jgi:hypothetical protein